MSERSPRAGTPIPAGTPGTPIAAGTAGTKERASVAGAVRADWLKWMPAIAVTAVFASVFTVVIRRSELLAGERTLTRWFSELDVAGVRTVVDILDFISDDAVAPVVFVLIIPVVWLAWGRYAALTYFATGAITALTRIT
ncbi:MAG: hypothetical protein IIC29_06440, partial [Chloroflexi bacterium]|nr:hypothetical protein [Chloroflexota bacterium]